MTRHRGLRLFYLGSVGFLLLNGVRAAAAQMQGTGLQFGAQAVLVANGVNPIPGGGRRTELHLEQPLLGLSGLLLDRHLRFTSALSLERLTTSNGVLTLGAWGDGYYDREHPHDYLHEAMVSLVGNILQRSVPGAISLSGGKGVVPFGSDPPMARAPLRAPVNHHWSQVMDRWLVSLAIHRAPIGLEVAFFDASGKVAEPPPADTGAHAGHGCGVFPCRQPRFGDSRSLRLTASPGAGVELRGSIATISGSGHHPGAGNSPEHLWNLTSRVDRRLGPGEARVLVEVGRARVDRTYWTALAEGQWSLREHRVYYRIERTDRPEGPRDTDPFRAAPDTLDPQSVGVTRWTVHTLGYAFAVRRQRLLLEPVIELSAGSAVSTGTPVVDLEALYGRRTFWSALVGLRMGFGAMHAMGHYGALADPGSSAGHHH